MSKVIDLKSYRNSWHQIFTNQQDKTTLKVSASDKTSEVTISLIGDNRLQQDIKLSTVDTARLIHALNDFFSMEKE